MRGKVSAGISPFPACRITPAYAGKSRDLIHAVSTTQDHPRLCGEKPTKSGNVYRKSGSPPPMRGKGDKTTEPRENVGITPAYAGKSEAHEKIS